MKSILREYIRSVLTESVSTDGYAVFHGEYMLNPSLMQASLVDVAKFNEAMSKEKKTSLLTDLDHIKVAARDSVVGYIVVGPPNEGKAWGAWEVTRIAGKGYGKILYSIGYALSPNGLLMPDRVSVSDDARAAWRSASKKLKSLPLDPLPPENKTETPEDDARFHEPGAGEDEADVEFLNRAYVASGDEKKMFDDLVAAGERLEEELTKKIGKKALYVIGAFMSGGSRLFMGAYSKT